MQWYFRVIYDFVIPALKTKKKKERKEKVPKVLKCWTNSVKFPAIAIADEKEGSFIHLIRFLKEGKGLSVVPVSIISLKGLI